MITYIDAVELNCYESFMWVCYFACGIHEEGGIFKLPFLPMGSFPRTFKLIEL